MTRRRPNQTRIAALAVLMAASTGAGAAALGDSGWQVIGAGAYVAATFAALLSPAALIFQVIGGQLLAASVVFAWDPPQPLLLLPVVIGVVATAELLAVLGRSPAPAGRDSGDALRRIGATVSIAAVVFGIVSISGRLPGPTGILGTALASVACIVLAVLLTTTRDSSRS